MRYHAAHASALLILILFAGKVIASDVELPDGKGKEAVLSTCTDCHDTARIQAQHLDEEGWSSIIREMIETGANINPDDMKIIISYLAKNFGPDSNTKVNINKAPADKIATVLQLTASEADAIVRYRAKYG